MGAPKKYQDEWGSGRVRWIPPDQEWLYDQYITQEKSCRTLAAEVGCGRGTLKGWLVGEGIPLRKWRRDSPSREWLEYHYLVLEETAEEIAYELGTTGPTVALWLREAGISGRTRAQAMQLRAKWMRREEHSGWTGGSKSYLGRLAQAAMKSAGVPKVCTGSGPHKGELVVHHKDEDRRNNSLGNLQYLCRACHARVHDTLNW